MVSFIWGAKMNLKENIVDIIVPFYPTEQGYAKLEKLKQSLKDVDPGFPWRLVVAEANQSAILNRNLGLRMSDTRYWVGVDDDVVFLEKDWLKKAMDKIKSDDKIGLIGFRSVNDKGETTNAGRIILNKEGVNCSVDTRRLMEKGENGDVDFDVKKDRPLNLVPGCCILIDRLVAGFWAEKLYPGKVNCDDSDFMLQTQANGFLVYYMGSIAVQHHYNDFEEKTKIYGLTDKDSINHVIFAKRWEIKTI